ncbi:MAG: RNA methyltransferase [Bacteroidota bacterium]|nr:RNA methyltransferase [Bacteroidota bacterium]
MMFVDKKKEELFNHLKELVTQARFNNYVKNINQRTRYLTVVLEDIYQPHNASAVLRTCDCFGIQDVHIIENKNEYIINPDVALGSSKWLNLSNYNSKKNNSPEVVAGLRKKGYRIVATTPHTDGVKLEDFDISKGKIAIFLGNEKDGLSDYIINEADEYLKIPMYGFTESFNISVSAAIILHHLSYKLRSSKIQWPLSPEEKSEILFSWLRDNIKKVELIEKKFYEKYR